jgi:hypothetical protein
MKLNQAQGAHVSEMLILVTINKDDDWLADSDAG